MRIARSVTTAFAAAFMFATAAHAAFTGYIKIPDIDGELRRAEVLDARFGADGLAAPPADRAGMVEITLKRGFSGRDALQKLYMSSAEIPEMTLVGRDGRKAVQYKLERVFIKSWSTSGDADDRPTEEVAFYYNKISVD